MVHEQVMQQFTVRGLQYLHRHQFLENCAIGCAKNYPQQRVNVTKRPATSEFKKIFGAKHASIHSDHKAGQRCIYEG